MANGIPTLVGMHGAFAGEMFHVEHLKPLVIGRSRSADISLKRTSFYRLQSEEQHQKDEASQTISARHFQITVYNLQSIELKNISINGTYLDGKAFDTVIVSDLAQRSHEITFGENGALRLELRPAE